MTYYTMLGPGLLEIGSRSTEDVPLLISEDVLIAEDVPLAQKARQSHLRAT